MKNRAYWALLLCLPLVALAESSTSREIKQVLALEPDAERGRELFARCADCHGPEGGGETSGSIPRIAGQHYRVVVRQFVDFRRGKRWDMRMEGVVSSHETFSELQEIADVAWHVSRLEADSARGVGDGVHVELGAKLYAEKCASCHGKEGEGSETREIPRIAGQHAAYLARQIYDAVDDRRPQLSRSHGKRFKPFAFEEILGLTDYLSRLGWKSEPAQPAAVMEDSPGLPPGR